MCHSSDAISKRPEALKVVEYVKAGKRDPMGADVRTSKVCRLPSLDSYSERGGLLHLPWVYGVERKTCENG